MDVKKISLRDRVSQFANGQLCVKGNVIFCNACKEVVSSKKSILVSHCSSKNHVSGKDKLKMSKLREQTIKAAQGKRVKWATDYIKCDFSTVIFTDECRAMLDGPDGFSRGWIGHGFETPFRLRRQQGGGGVMFWAGICGETLIGPFMVEERVKMDSEAYAHFLKQNFLTGTRFNPFLQQEMNIYA